MFKSKTLFVVGAGASHEVGLPLGVDLKNTISDLLNIHFSNYKGDHTGDGMILSALRHHVRLDGSNDVNPYLHAARNIAEALPLASSIDNFLDAHRNNSQYILCGKLAITRAILMAESESPLKNIQNSRGEFSFRDIDDSWFIPFFNMLTEEKPKEELENIFSNISFISFNYDRCIEHFIAMAIECYYKISQAKARELASRISILHPYGVVGDLPWKSNAINPINFGESINSEQLLELSKNIRIFTERIDDPKARGEIQKPVTHSKKIVFLGFGYHEQNMDLLTSNQQSAVRYVYGTALGSSESDCNIVESQLKGKVTQIHYLSTEIRKDLSCSKLLKEYRKSIIQ